MTRYDVAAGFDGRAERAVVATEMAPFAADDADAMACERALEALIFGARPGSSLPVDEWLAGAAAADGTAEALRRQLAGRLGLYRELVRERIDTALSQMLSRTRAFLGVKWEAELQFFFEESGPSSPVLRELSNEWVSWARRAWRERAEIPAWLADFALFESLEVEVGTLGALIPTSGPAAFDAETRFDCARQARLVHFDYAVHELGAGMDQQVVRRPTFVLAYADPDYRVRYLELSPFAAELWRGLDDAPPLGEAVARAIARVSLDGGGIDGLFATLADWYGRGLIRVVDEPDRTVPS